MPNPSHPRATLRHPRDVDREPRLPLAPEGRDVMPPAGSALELRHELDERLADARARTDEIFRILKPEALYERPIPERHRLVFYLGHLEAFDWNLIGRARLRSTRVRRRSSTSCSRSASIRSTAACPTDQPSDWPSLAEVQRLQRGACAARSIACLRDDDRRTRPVLARRPRLPGRDRASADARRDARLPAAISCRSTRKQPRVAAAAGRRRHAP